MPRKYKRVENKKRAYGSSSVEDLTKAEDFVKKGWSLKKAAEKCNVKKSTLGDFVKRNREKNGSLSKPVGGQTYIPAKDEKILADLIDAIAEWGFPLSFNEVRYLLKYLLDEEGLVTKWKDNIPGWDWLYGFRKRNKLSARMASNIKRSRAQVNEETVRNFFKNEHDIIAPENIVNYDETNLTDDPGKKWVLVRRGRRRVENVKDSSKTSISVMWAGTAAGQMLPPCVVYKSKNTYEGWTAGATRGTYFTQSERGWFDSKTFEEWFFNVVLPFYAGKPGVKVLIVDNLGSHFSATVVRAAKAQNILFVMLPTNGWKKESQRHGAFPKEVFPILLNKLWVLLEDKLSDYLKSGFRTCGLYPIDETEILKKLPQKPSGDAVQILNEAVIKMFESQRKAPPPKRKRDKKLEHYKAGSVLALEGEPHKNNDVEDDDHCSKSAGCSNANENVC